MATYRGRIKHFPCFSHTPKPERNQGKLEKERRKEEEKNPDKKRKGGRQTFPSTPRPPKIRKIPL
jgi:hypothetical protein